MEQSFFTKENYVGIGIGFFLLLVGFFCLAQGPVDGFLTMNVAPVILAVTYCIVFPVAILWRKREK